MIKLPRFLLNEDGKLDGMKTTAMLIVGIIGLLGFGLFGEISELQDTYEDGVGIEQYLVEGAPEIVEVEASLGIVLLMFGILWLVLVLLMSTSSLGNLLTKNMKRGPAKFVVGVIPATIAACGAFIWLDSVGGPSAMGYLAVVGGIIVVGFIASLIRPWANRLDKWWLNKRVENKQEGIEYREQQLVKAREELEEVKGKLAEIEAL